MAPNRSPENSDYSESSYELDDASRKRKRREIRANVLRDKRNKRCKTTATSAPVPTTLSLAEREAELLSGISDPKELRIMKNRISAERSRMKKINLIDSLTCSACEQLLVLEDLLRENSYLKNLSATQLSLAAEGSAYSTSLTPACLPNPRYMMDHSFIANECSPSHYASQPFQVGHQNGTSAFSGTETAPTFSHGTGFGPSQPSSYFDCTSNFLANRSTFSGFEAQIGQDSSKTLKEVNDFDDFDNWSDVWSAGEFDVDDLALLEETTASPNLHTSSATVEIKDDACSTAPGSPRSVEDYTSCEDTSSDLYSTVDRVTECEEDDFVEDDCELSSLFSYA